MRAIRFEADLWAGLGLAAASGRLARAGVPVGFAAAGRAALALGTVAFALGFAFSFGPGFALQGYPDEGNRAEAF